MIWIEEAEKSVWHKMIERTGTLSYRAACGWHMTPIHGRMWPQKADEPGPPHETRCRTCVRHG